MECLRGGVVTTFIGFPNTIRTDQESVTTSQEFRSHASLYGIHIEFTGVSSHNSMGKIESAHGPLCTIYRTLRDRYPDLSDSPRLRCEVNALNDTADTNGLVPSLLVFGTIPSLGDTESELADQEQRFNEITAARKEVATIIAEKRIRPALKSKIPPSARYTLRTGRLD